LKPKDTAKDLTNPLLEKYLTTKPKAKKPAAPALRQGHLPEDSDSFFAVERGSPSWRPDLNPTERRALRKEMAAQEARDKVENDKKLTSMNLDPDPEARLSLERRLVIAGVKRHGRMTKAQTLARTERQSLYKSQNLPTSTKKLQKVVNQLAGKTVSEALVQLRFSPKRIARDVIKGLEFAQDEAIAGYGMGLGGGKRAQERWEAQRANSALPRSTRDVVEKMTREDGAGGPKNIELKDGSKKRVKDPSEIYIDQIWVGKGEMWMSPEYRARGAVNMLRHRTTSKSTSCLY
jgi:ribosomal protein L22